MARHKTQEFKRFAIAKRRSIGSSLSAAPVWTFQKANRRHSGKTQKRQWKTVGMKKMFTKQQHKITTQANKHMRKSFLKNNRKSPKKGKK